MRRSTKVQERRDATAGTTRKGTPGTGRRGDGYTDTPSAIRIDPTSRTPAPANFELAEVIRTRTTPVKPMGFEVKGTKLALATGSGMPRPAFQPWGQRTKEMTHRA